MKSLIRTCILVLGVICNPCRSQSLDEDNIIKPELDVNIRFDVPELKNDSPDVFEEATNKLIEDALMYFERSSLNISFNVESIHTGASASDKPKYTNEYFNEYCKEEESYKTSKPYLSILFTKIPISDKKVITEPGSYCDTSKNCAVLDFRSWPENTFNLVRAIAASVGIQFDGSPESQCNAGFTIMTLLYDENYLPESWSHCSKSDLQGFLKSPKALCLRRGTSNRNLANGLKSDSLFKPNQLDDDRKFKINLQLLYDVAENSLSLKWEEMHSLMQNAIEAYFSYDMLRVPIEVNITLVKNIEGNAPQSTHTQEYLAHYCKAVKRTDISDDFLIIVTQKDIYGLDEHNRKNYDSVLDTEIGNFCNKSTNCALIEHDRLMDDVFNIVRALARSMGVSFDAVGNNTCKEDDTIMAKTYDGQNPPRKWSSCSQNDFDAFLRSSKSSCLKRNTKSIEVQPGDQEDNDSDLQIDIKLHFAVLRNNHLSSTNATDIAGSIVKQVEDMLGRCKLGLNVKLNVVTIKLEDKENSLNQNTLDQYCNQLATSKAETTPFSALLIEEVNDGYSFNNPWENELRANRKSMCEKNKNCAIVNWSSTTSISSTAARLARALAISLGARRDEEESDGDDTIMSSGPSVVDSISEWSQCSRDSITTYLISDASNCLKKSGRFTQTKPMETTSMNPIQTYPTQKYPTQEYPTQKYPTQEYPTQKYPTQEYPTQEYPTQEYPTQKYPDPPKANVSDDDSENKHYNISIKGKIHVNITETSYEN